MNAVFPLAFGLTLVASALVTVPVLIVDWAARTTPEVVFSVPLNERVVALTIDDGPSSATGRILEVLAENDARATFFLIGENLQLLPEEAARILKAGHEVGHHMMQDTPSRDLPDDVFQRRFDEMQGLLEEVGGSRVFRPGSGWYDEGMIRWAEHRGYSTVLGSVYPFDAHVPWPAFASWYILQNTVPGSILVLHDGPERGLRTAEVLARILPELQRRGYTIVTASTLIERGEAPSG